VGIIHQIINPNLSLGIGDIPYKNPNRIDNQMMDISALKRDTGFSPKTIFEEGISKTIDYFRGLSSRKNNV
jgi:nucleoside-diphosphate-sugar epimerase